MMTFEAITSSTTSWDETVMNVSLFRLSRRSAAIAAVLVGMVSLAIGAHAALNMRALDAAKAIETEPMGAVGKHASKIALVIGNGNYPDASAPLSQPINDARALTSALRGNGFDVDVIEDASKDDMSRAVERLKSKIRPDSVVMLFFGGYGVLEGSRRPPRRALDRSRAGGDEGEGRPRKTRRHRRLAAQPL
jgi:hypothetical protein